MKEKYTIKLLDMPVSIVSDEGEETVLALAKKLKTQGENAKMDFLAIAISDTKKDLTNFMEKNS